MSDIVGSQYRVLGKTHYERNKDYYLRRNAARRKEIRAFLDEDKASKGCVDCGFNDPRALDYDHVRGEKDTEMSKAASNQWGQDRLEAEIAKCDVRCANCHRIATEERRK